MLRNSAEPPQGTLRRARAHAKVEGDLGNFCMTDQLSPAFHAEDILVFFNEYGCFQKASQHFAVQHFARTRGSSQSASSERTGPRSSA
jgi:hypothetical protein